MGAHSLRWTPGRSFRPLQISRLEKVATRTILKNLVDHKETNPILYTVGRGESALSERQVFHNRVVVLSKVAGINRSTTCMETRGTVRVEDDPIIRFVPIFSEASKTDARFDEQFDGFGGGQKGFLSALDDERKELLLRYVVAGCDGSPTVFSVLREHDHFKQPQTDYVEIYNRSLRERWRAERSAELERVARGEASGYTEAEAVAIRNLVGDYRQRSLGLLLHDRLEPPPTHFKLLHFSARGGATKRDGMALAATARDNYETMAGRYRNFFCRRCLAYNCLNHGINQPIPSTRCDPRYPAVKASLRLQREVEEKIGRSAPDEIGALIKEEALASPPEVVDVDADSPKPEKSEDGGGVASTTTGESTADENDDDGNAIRRSARSLTAASTKASTILISQRSKEKKKSPYTRSYRGPHSDISEYLGQDMVYRSIAMEKRTAVLSPDTPCSRDCAKLRSSTSENGGRRGGEWTPAEVLLLGKIEKCLGSQPCVIATILMTRSCADVAAYVRHRREAVEETETLISYKLNSRDLARPVGARGNSHDHLRRTRMQRMKDRGANHEYVPCNHEGISCNSGDCSCMRRDHYCEKACGCPQDCANRFPGCKCDPGECRSTTCPCYVAGRECDPDLCFSCGACEVPVEVHDAASRIKWRNQNKLCGNVNILRGRVRKVGVAASDTHGWGAFAREPMKKGDFIYEYTGELLSQDEAERRGNIYDKSTVSFLFDLNEDAVVDATRKGNKSKFANHSSANEKCVAKILRVNGEHRIGVFANADIETNEELFFNYGYHGVVPDWTQARVASAKHSIEAEAEAEAELETTTVDASSDVKMEEEPEDEIDVEGDEEERVEEQDQQEEQAKALDQQQEQELGTEQEDQQA